MPGATRNKARTETGETPLARKMATTAEESEPAIKTKATISKRGRSKSIIGTQAGVEKPKATTGTRGRLNSIAGTQTGVKQSKASEKRPAAKIPTIKGVTVQGPAVRKVAAEKLPILERIDAEFITAFGKPPSPAARRTAWGKILEHEAIYGRSMMMNMKFDDGRLLLWRLFLFEATIAEGQRLEPAAEEILAEIRRLFRAVHGPNKAFRPVVEPTGKKPASKKTVKFVVGSRVSKPTSKKTVKSIVEPKGKKPASKKTGKSIVGPDVKKPASKKLVPCTVLREGVGSKNRTPKKAGSKECDFEGGRF